MRFKYLYIILLIISLISITSATVTQYNFTDGAYTVIIFNGTGTTTWTTPVSTCDILIVGGGGSGGKGAAGLDNAGGGGSGGVLNGTLTGLSGSYSISVGAGGIVQTTAQWAGFNGTESYFDSWIANGGGAGGAAPPNNTGRAGGSGGGGGWGSGAGGITTQGNIPPLTGHGFDGAIGSAGQGAGGGGATRAGQAACASDYAPGFTSNITGTSTVYGTGGACGHTKTGTNGLGEGGDGTDGTSYAGGSGVVIIRYLTSGGIAPIANFTSNITTDSVYPLVVRFNDTSTESPTTWNWSFGDGRWFNTTNPLLKNTTYQYAVAGKYTVNLTVNNTNGSNTISKPDYINLTSDVDNVTSWLHMNGTNGTTTFSDEMGVAWSTGGPTYLSTNIFKYGGASGAFPRNPGPAGNNYIFTSTQPAFNFSTNDFTIELWVNISSIPDGASTHIFSKTVNTRTRGWGLSSTNGTQNGWSFWMGNDSVNGLTPFFSIPFNTWTHIVIERESGIIKVYINGNLTTSKAGYSANYDTVDPMWIGRQSNNYYSGYMDEFRISNTLARWKSNFTPPYNEYKGFVEDLFPDINPNSTMRYKTNATDPAPIANQTNGGIRNRTLQIQNITNASYVTGGLTFNPLYVYVKSVQLNLSTYPTGMTLLSSAIDNNNGQISFNISRPGGFFTGLNRSSILDYTALYYNYTNGSDNTTQFFTSGFLINETTNKTYGIHFFEPVTQIVYEDWNFTASAVADNLTIINGTSTFFTSSFTGAYPNRWNWSFGDGTVDNGINSSVSHIYNSAGLKTINLTEYLWQNLSVSNTTIKTNYIEVQDSPPIVIFTSNTTSGNSPLAVQFNDTSTGIVTNWNWSYKNVTGNNTQTWFSTLQNPIFTFGVGNWSISLNASNPNGGVNESDGSYYVNVSAVTAPVADFTSTSSGGPSPPITVQFNDTSTHFPTSWNWSFGDGNVSALENPSHIYEFCGDFDVLLRVENSGGFSWNNKSNYIVIPCITPTTTPSAQTKIADKVMDTQNFIYIGVILIIVAGIIIFAGKLLTKKSQ